MSDKPISVGDLVVVVKPTLCCGQLGKSFGAVFRVSHIRERTYSRCAHCGSSAITLLADGWRAAISLYRLKRIPPLSELEGEKRDEEIPA